MSKKRSAKKASAGSTSWDGQLEQYMNHYHHAHLYYITMVVAMVMLLLTLVQGIRYQLDDQIGFAIGFYIISVLLFIVAHSSYTRGKGHYHYHRHLK